MRSSRVCPGWSSSSLRPGPGPVGVDASQLELVAEAGLDEVSKPDIVIVPGGPFSHDELDGDVIEWLREVHGTTTWTTSVCTGALLLGGGRHPRRDRGHHPLGRARVA